MTIKIATVFLCYLFYWFCCFLGTGTDRKNLAGLRSYPDAVQREVRAHPELGKAAPQEKSLLSILLGNLLLFTVVFSVLGLTLKSNYYKVKPVVKQITIAWPVHKLCPADVLFVPIVLRCSMMYLGRTSQRGCIKSVLYSHLKLKPSKNTYRMI